MSTANSGKEAEGDADRSFARLIDQLMVVNVAD